MEAIARRRPDVMRHAFWSAKTTDYGYLRKMLRSLQDLADPQSAASAGSDLGPRPSALGSRRVPLSAGNFRVAMREALASIGYSPGAAGVPEDSVEDLASDRRLDLIIHMRTRMVWGGAAHKRRQEALDDFPCQELVRFEERIIKRNWPQRWREAAAATGDVAAAGVLQRHGRMIARADSPIWRELSRFGTPHPPFDYNSGMWTESVSRDEAVALGVIESAAVIQPDPTEIPEDLPLTPSPETPGSAALTAALREALGPNYTLGPDGILRHASRA